MTFNEAFNANSNFQILFKGQNFNFSSLNEIYRKLQIDFEQINPKPGEFLLFKNSNHPLHLLLFLLCEKYKLVFVPIYENSTNEETQLHIDKLKPEITVSISDNLNFTANFERKSHNSSAKLTARLNKKMQGCLFQTSGTTGEPGYILQSFENILLNAHSAAAGQNISSQSKILSLLTFCHVGGLCMQTTAALLKGAEIHIADRTQFAEALELLQHCTHSILVPSYFRILSKLNTYSAVSFKNSPLIVTGSTQVPLSLIRDMKAKGLRVQVVYGLTEIGPYTCTFEYNSDQSDINGNVATPIGTPLNGYNFKISEIDNEILISGSCIGVKYEIDTADFKSITDLNGYLHTGDKGVCYENVFYISGRIKTQISVGGLKVSPHEIEEVLLRHPNVKACAAIGIPHPSLGEVVKAFVVTDAPDRRAFKHEIYDLLRENLSRHKIPRSMKFVDRLPNTSIGKNNLAEIKKVYEK